MVGFPCEPCVNKENEKMKEKKMRDREMYFFLIWYFGIKNEIEDEKVVLWKGLNLEEFLEIRLVVR